MFSGSIKGEHLEETSQALTHFSLIFLICAPCKRQKTLGLLLFPGGIKSEHWEEMGEILSYYMVIFTQFKNSFFFKEKVSLTAFGFLNGFFQENPCDVGYPVFMNMSVQINNLQTQWVEITLIQCCFIVTTLKQRWANVTSTPCLQGNYQERYQENIHNRVDGYNLSKITKFIFIALHLMKLPKLPKSVIPPKHLRIVASAS